MVDVNVDVCVEVTVDVTVLVLVELPVEVSVVEDVVDAVVVEEVVAVEEAVVVLVEVSVVVMVVVGQIGAEKVSRALPSTGYLHVTSCSNAVQTSGSKKESRRQQLRGLFCSCNVSASMSGKFTRPSSKITRSLS